MPPVLIEASVLPSGLNATDSIRSLSPLIVRKSLPVTTSQSLMTPFQSAEANVVPVRLIEMAKTAFVCPFKVALFLRVATSQSLIFLSRLAEISVLPSGLNATAVTW